VHAFISDFITDMVQNALEAGADCIRLTIEETVKEWTFCVEDNGRGMNEAARARAGDPFYTEAGKHEHRRFGLGIPFLKQAVEAAGGRLSLESKPGCGTTVKAVFEAQHVDTPPPGNLPGTVIALMSFSGSYELEVIRRRAGGEWSVRRSELTEALGGLDGAEELAAGRNYLSSLEEELSSGRSKDG
jgi:hypothetical protein